MAAPQVTSTNYATQAPEVVAAGQFCTTTASVSSTLQNRRGQRRPGCNVTDAVRAKPPRQQQHQRRHHAAAAFFADRFWSDSACALAYRVRQFVVRPQEHIEVTSPARPDGTGYRCRIEWRPQKTEGHETTTTTSCPGGGETVVVEIGPTEEAARHAAMRAILQNTGPPTLQEALQVAAQLVSQLKGAHRAHLVEKARHDDASKDAAFQHEIIWKAAELQRQGHQAGMVTAMGEGTSAGEAQLRARAALLYQLDGLSLAKALPSKRTDSSAAPAATAPATKMGPTPTMTLLPAEAADIMQRSQQIMARLGVEETVAFGRTGRNNTLHTCTSTWTYLREDGGQEQQPTVVTAEAAAPSRRAARALTRVKLLEAIGVEDPMSPEDRDMARKVRAHLDAHRVSEAVDACCLFVRRSLSPDSWVHVVPAVWHAALASYTIELVTKLAETLASRPLPVLLWETLLDACTVLSNGGIGYTALGLLTGGYRHEEKNKSLSPDATTSKSSSLTTTPAGRSPILVDPSAFPSPAVRGYFQNYRAMLAFELRADFSNRAALAATEDDQTDPSFVSAILLDVTNVTGSTIRLQTRVDTRMCLPFLYLFFFSCGSFPASGECP